MTRFIQAILLRPALTAIMALRALRRNKLRSSLTGLGIIIGVAAVVTMIAVVNGARAKIEGQVASLGQNLLVVFAGNKRTAGVNAGLGTSSTITLADAEAMRREVPDVVGSSPAVRANVQIVANGRNWFTQLTGESSEYLTIRNWSLDSGLMFTERDVRAAAKVAVLGSKAAMHLFGPENPIGRVVRVKSIPFVVIGLLTSKGAGLGGYDQDDVIIVPYTTAMKRVTGEKHLKVVCLGISGADRMAVVQQQVTSLLRQRHRLTPGREDDFNIFSQKEIGDTVGSISTVITLLLGSVAGISLLVGGIGIMNIMLVSVTERTREIGIRIAVGAQAGDIMLQFLIEAVTLSLLGGITGILMGVGAARLISVTTGFNAIVTPGSVILAFSVSVAIGVFFGFYPARRAAALDPIEALRYE